MEVAFLFNKSVMYGWLLIMYFKPFFPFVLCFYPPGKTGYIIGEACGNENSEPFAKNLIRSLRVSKSRELN